MIYAIAAYSITLGSLALYWVFLQDRERRLSVERAGMTNASLPDPSRGLNVGAALLTPIWMWVHGLRLPGAIVGLGWIAMIPLLSRSAWIPLALVGGVVLAAGAALGVVGNRIVAQRAAGAGLADPFAREWLFAVAGIVLFAFVVPWGWYFLFFAPAPPA